MTKVHLDTDLGGDIDDLCALAMLLRWPSVALTGITVVGDTNGIRTGYTRYALGLEGRTEIPVAAGADTAQGFYRSALPPQDRRYWPAEAIPSPNSTEKAIELLKKSIEDGATIISIGPLTNLYLVDTQYPGILARANLYLMGGFIYPLRPGYPNWKNEFDFNLQVDVKSARHVLGNSSPTLVPISVTAETALRRSAIEKLRTAGALGQLIARQAETFAADEKMDAVYGATCARVPDDIVNFQHDPLACAIAVGWNEGVEIEELPIVVEEEDGWLRERVDKSGRKMKVVTKIDGPRFSEFWLSLVAKS
jgi:inosine-uridine nucleoside N-ribohydrolase